VYLYGTTHAAGAEDVPPIAWDKLAASPTFVAEADTSALDPDVLVEWSFLPRGPGLDQLVGADVWFDLRDALIGEVKEDALRRMRPWAALSALTAHVAPSPRPIMDEALRARAAARNARLEFLDSWEDQFRALDAAVGADDLAQAVRDVEHMACNLEAMRRAYRAGDLAALAGRLGEADEATLIVARNERWLARLEAHLDGPGAFVAVGVGHLAGERGLPALLAGRGYRVARIRTDPR
jgi:uncharacterized protein YbaP (TraB family)